MRVSRLLSVPAVLLVLASTSFAGVTTLRTGQVGGAPGICSGSDDTFRFYAPNPSCGQPVVPTPFTTADFAAACAGPPAVVIDPAAPPWTPSLDCDPEARWISTGTTFNCYGAPVSALYCAPFANDSQCAVADSIRICWAVDDFLGDQPSFPGPNPGGVYVNGNDLGPAFSGPGSNPTYTAVAYNVPLVAGVNTLAVYQRDAGCSISGLILSAKIYTRCGSVSTDAKQWSRIKSLYR